LPVIVVVFYLPEYFPATRSWSNLAAAGIFVAAAITDWLDGWIARRYNMSSAFGAFLDPVADKLMVAVALFLIVQQNPSALMAVASAVIVGREISISALREWMAELGKRAAVGVAWLGKFKTVMQIVAIVVCLHQRDFPELRLYRIGEGLLVVAAVLTIGSAIVYVRAAWPIMRDADSGKI
jgi:CDP-diacylglycerol--glycerol-3-phosphate 3-phosphatidyltransferase